MTLALGIDPGTATTGYGLVRLAPDGSLLAVKYGVFLTPKASSASARLEMLYNQLHEVLDEYKPETAAVEKLFFSIENNLQLFIICKRKRETNGVGTTQYIDIIV